MISSRLAFVVRPDDVDDGTVVVVVVDVLVNVVDVYYANVVVCVCILVVFSCRRTKR